MATTRKRRKAEKMPAESVDALEVIVHWIEPTEADRRRLEQCWRDLIGRRLNEAPSPAAEAAPEAPPVPPPANGRSS